MRRIAILVHQHDAFEREPYFMREFAAVWRESGFDVTVRRGPGPHVDADLAVLHVDLTIIPERYMDCVRRYRRVINGRVSDISKRRIGAHFVRRQDGYAGPVLVKTNRNYGGKREALFAQRNDRWQRLLHSMRERLPWGWKSGLEVSSYRIFDSPEQVPWIVWHNRDLVVQRFLPERRHDLFCLRTWIFLGDRETNSLSYSRQPIVKSDNVVRREAVDEIPDELRRMRQELGFDFGKFDYAIVDGRVVLYDANRTPSLGNFPREQYLPRVRLLAQGINAFL